MPNRSNFNRFVLRTLRPFIDNFPLQYWLGKKQCRIAYRHLQHPLPTEGQTGGQKLLILVNGRAENLLKWTEIAYDFYQQGYDILMFDHRGQGYSQRLLMDNEKGYIDDFRYYVEDMRDLIQHINSQYSYQKQYLISHSMGGLISAHYLANYDHNIQKAIFLAPFWGVPLRKPNKDNLTINLFMLFGQGQRYVFGKGPFQPVNLASNKLSQDHKRLRWFNRIHQFYPDLRLGGPTFRWLHLCINAIAQLPKILSRIEIPVLVLTAEQESVVSNQHLSHQLKALEQVEHCVIQKAKHEILFETDEIRHQASEKISQFLNQS